MADPRGFSTLTGDDLRTVADVVDAIEQYGSDVQSVNVSNDTDVVRASIDITFSRYHPDKADDTAATALDALEADDHAAKPYADTAALYLNDEDPASAVIEIMFQRGDADG